MPNLLGALAFEAAAFDSVNSSHKKGDEVDLRDWYCESVSDLFVYSELLVRCVQSGRLRPHRGPRRRRWRPRPAEVTWNALGGS